MFVAINHIHIKAGADDQLEELFDQGEPMREVEGFLEFTLVKKTWEPGHAGPPESDGGGAETRDASTGGDSGDSGGGQWYLAITKWTSRTAFQAWVHSDHFKRIHGRSDTPDIFLPGGGPAGYQVVANYAADPQS